MRTAYVTGSTGFVGLNLIEELVRQEWRVVALHRPQSRLDYLQRFPVTRAEGDITDPSSLARTMPRNVDAVFHVAGSSDLWSKRNAEQDDININGTRNVADAAMRANAKRLVFTSSNSAFGMHTGIINENTKQHGGLSSLNYQRSKYFAEEEVRKAVRRGLDAVILNPSGIIGPYLNGGYLRMFRMVESGRLLCVPPGALSFCDSRDVAKAHIAAVDRGRTGHNYLLAGADASLLQLAQVMGEVSGKRAPHHCVPRWILKAMGGVGSALAYLTGEQPVITTEMAAMLSRRMFCDCTKAQRELGYEPRPVRTMLADCYSWLKNEGLLGKLK